MPTFNDKRLNHLLDHILLETDSDGDYHQAIFEYQGVNNIFDLMAIPAIDIEAFKYKPNAVFASLATWMTIEPSLALLALDK